VREARSKGEGSDERARGRLQPVTGQPEPDHEHGDRDEDDERLEPDASPDEQPSDVAFADGNVLERRRLGPVEEEDIERVERVEGREEEMARNVEWDEELRKSSGARRVISEAGLSSDARLAKGRGGARTVTRNRRGWMSRKMKQKAATRPAQAKRRPKRSLRKLVKGERLENAFARRKRG
jgi:hypothetical protein